MKIRVVMVLLLVTVQVLTVRGEVLFEHIEPKEISASVIEQREKLLDQFLISHEDIVSSHYYKVESYKLTRMTRLADKLILKYPNKRENYVNNINLNIKDENELLDFKLASPVKLLGSLKIIEVNCTKIDDEYKYSFTLLEKECEKNCEKVWLTIENGVRITVDFSLTHNENSNFTWISGFDEATRTLIYIQAKGRYINTNDSGDAKGYKKYR